MKRTFKTIVAAGAFAATAFVTTAQAADFEPVVQYSDWAFRFEGAAGYADTELGVGFEFGDIADVDASVGIDGPIMNTAFSASFQGPVLWTQLDGVFGLTNYSGGGGSSLYTQFSGGVHMGWRDATRGMFAVNVAATGVNFQGSEAFGDTDFLRVGGVGELFFDQFTVGAGGGFVTSLNGGDDNPYAKGLVRWYASDNLKLEAHGGAVFGSGDVEFIYGRALVEWKPDDSRIGYFARWDGFFIDETQNGLSLTVDSHAAMAGIRIYFGEPSTTTVKEQDRVHFADSCAFGAAGQFLSIC